MIPIICLMVGMYIITRMIHLLIDKRKEINIFTGALAIVTILVSIYAIFYCLTKGAEVAQFLK